MFGSAMLDTVIGLVFVYLLLSVIVSSAKELLETLIKRRSADLERGIRLLLDDKAGTGLAKAFFAHPLICCLYKYDYDSQGNIVPETLPSYIPAQSFAMALMDMVLPAGQANASGVSKTLAAPVQATPAAPETQSVQQFRDAVLKIENPKVRQVLLALVDAAGNDITRVRENIEAWFNGTMDRVTGWYRRWSQGVIFFIGLALTIGMNADTIAIFEYLSQNKEARETLITAAEEQVAKPEVSPATNGTEQSKLKQSLQTINALGLPLGWNQVDASWMVWLRRALGWLLTAFAVSLGAPFWFDILNKFIDVRSTLKTDRPPKTKSDTQNAS